MNLRHLVNYSETDKLELGYDLLFGAYNMTF